MYRYVALQLSTWYDSMWNRNCFPEDANSRNLWHALKSRLTTPTAERRRRRGLSRGERGDNS